MRFVWGFGCGDYGRRKLMGRTLPYECKHGVVIAWNDFGPCQNCDEHEDEECPNFEDCPDCDAEFEATKCRHCNGTGRATTEGDKQ